MASKRLTNLVRRKLISAAGEKGTEKQTAQLKRIETQVQGAAYRQVVPLKVQKSLKAIPEAHLAQGNYARFILPDGSQHYVDFDKEHRAGVPQSRAYIKIKAQSRLARLLTRREALKQEQKATRQEIERKAREIVWSVTTTGRLKELWPEAQQLVPGISLEAPEAITAIIPAGAVTEINQLLNLKRKAA